MPAESVPHGCGGVPRRRFLAWCGAWCGTWCALLPGVPALAKGSDADDEVQLLRQRSASLTGFPASALDEDFATALWRALSASGRLAAARAWLAGREPATAATEPPSALELEIAAAWYGGLVPGAVASVGAYYGALAWRAAPFATPAGRCAAPGHWAKPPRPVPP